jgi:hypothetical protein
MSSQTERKLPLEQFHSSALVDRWALPGTPLQCFERHSQRDHGIDVLGRLHL